MSGKVQLKAGMAGVCTILAYAKPYSFSIETSVQRKETRRPSSVEDQSFSGWKASLRNSF